MFVEIVRGNAVLKVTEKQYENMYKKLGYKLLNKTQKEQKLEQKTVVENVEEESENIETIPISEMNKHQLQEYARKHNIDTRNARNVTEARKIIQKAVRESNM